MNEYFHVGTNSHVKINIKGKKEVVHNRNRIEIKSNNDSEKKELRIEYLKAKGTK
ncbi:hypothetical protein [Erysipelothrix aquatica]|uniref:hypothetical protein n=1 Tax=Erysipelothrix aquatica TaxID=2683714 RepID=UPI00135CE64B|nr:hypothetical protein [Erysipelothrix aquatica]